MGFFDFFKRKEEIYDLDADDIFYARLSGGWSYQSADDATVLEGHLNMYKECENIAEVVRNRKIALGK